MPDLEKPPFPIPPLESALEQFPETAPWDVPIAHMSNWWLAIRCPVCNMGEGHYPLRLMSARIGWRKTLRQVVPKLKCKTCGGAPSSVVLEDSPAGEQGRYGAKRYRLKLV